MVPADVFVDTRVQPLGTGFAKDIVALAPYGAPRMYSIVLVPAVKLEETSSQPAGMESADDTLTVAPKVTPRIYSIVIVPDVVLADTKIHPGGKALVEDYRCYRSVGSASKIFDSLVDHVSGKKIPATR